MDLGPFEKITIFHRTPYHGQVPQIQQQRLCAAWSIAGLWRWNRFLSRRAPYVSPSRANGISKGASHSPWHTTSKGAPQYDYSKGARHTTYCLSPSVQKILFLLEVTSVGPRQNIAEHWLGTDLCVPSNSKISHIGVPMPAAPISCQIKPHNPSSPLTKLCWSQ